MLKKALIVLFFSMLVLPVSAEPESRTYAVLDALPVHWRDQRDGLCPADPAKPLESESSTCAKIESSEDRAERLRHQAEVIDSTYKEKWKKAMLMSVLYRESGNARVVIDCRLRGDGGRAVGGYQSHRHKGCVDFETQTAEAKRHLDMALRHCNRNPNRAQHLQVYSAVALYATGKSCSWKGAEKRVSTWKWIMARY